MADASTVFMHLIVWLVADKNIKVRGIPSLTKCVSASHGKKQM